MPFDNAQLPRQQVLRGAGLLLTAGALAACGDDSEKSTAGSEESTAAAPSSTAAAPSSTAAAADVVIAKTSDVPVGSGVIVDDVVVTQPTAGDFKGFSSTCTHKGCAVTTVANGTIDCPCHGSKFSLDGSVVNGPATAPLKVKAIAVQGDSIVLV